jgi:hypothetical protein
VAGRQLRLHFAIFDDAVEALARFGGVWWSMGVLLRQPDGWALTLNLPSRISAKPWAAGVPQEGQR